MKISVDEALIHQIKNGDEDAFELRGKEFGSDFFKKTG